ncbi:MAG: NAD-dependent epimerase/dehydratase family protein [Bacillota bacterium]
MKVFVTGGTGFIGSYVVPRLIESGHEVRCLVRSRERAAPLEKLGVQLVEGDVKRRDSFAEQVKGCDWVIHLASLYTFWEPDRREYGRVNIEGTRNVMEASLRAEVKKVVYVSSIVVWGHMRGQEITESTPMGRQNTDYARTKYEGYQVALGLHKQMGLPLVTLFPASVAGPGNDRPSGDFVRDTSRGKIPAVLCPDTVCTYVDVRDVAEAIVRAAEKPGNSGERYLVGKHVLSMRQLHSLITQAAEVRPPKMVMPGWLALPSAASLTVLANLTKHPPRLGLSLDLVRTLRSNLRFASDKAERELGIRYTPIERSIADEVAWHLGHTQHREEVRPRTPAGVS